MKIKFIKEPTGVGYAYFTGDTADLPKYAANELIADGYAEEVKAEGGRNHPQSKKTSSQSQKPKAKS